MWPKKKNKRNGDNAGQTSGKSKKPSNGSGNDLVLNKAVELNRKNTEELLKQLQEFNRNFPVKSQKSV